MFNRVLAVGAHPDDVEFGCSGSLLVLKNNGAEIKYLVFSKCTDLPRNQGIEKEWEKAIQILGLKKPHASLLDFPNRQLYAHEAKIREILETIRDNFQPSLVFTHSLDDVHQDHSTVRQECRRVFKSTTLLGYESPRSSVQFCPNYYFLIPDEIATRKRQLVECYQTQKMLPYANPEKIMATLQHYGTKINARYAEAFNLIRGLYKL